LVKPAYNVGFFSSIILPNSLLIEQLNMDWTVLHSFFHHLFWKRSFEIAQDFTGQIFFLINNPAHLGTEKEIMQYSKIMQKLFTYQIKPSEEVFPPLEGCAVTECFLLLYKSYPHHSRTQSG